MNESRIGSALGEALVAYGVAPNSSWVRDPTTGVISTNATTLSAGTAPGCVPSGPRSDAWYGHDANDHQSTIGIALKCPPALRLCLIGDSTLRLYGKKNSQYKAAGQFVKTSTNRTKSLKLSAAAPR